MYTLYNSFDVTGPHLLKKWMYQDDQWAAYSEYREKANHELYIPQTVLNLIIQGQKRMYEGNQVHCLQAGDILLIPGDTLICSEILWQRNNFRSINVVLPDEVIAQYSPFCTDTVLPKKALPLKTDTHWGRFAQELFRSFTATGLPLPARDVVIHQALRLIASQPDGAAILQMLSQGMLHGLPTVIQTVGSAINGWQALDDIASKAYVSKATLKRRFKAIYHTSPMNWIWQKRLELTGFLLRTSTKSIAEIAYTAGFENVPHFYRVFKNNYGVTPAQWRQGNTY